MVARAMDAVEDDEDATVTVNGRRVSSARVLREILQEDEFEEREAKECVHQVPPRKISRRTFADDAGASSAGALPEILQKGRDEVQHGRVRRAWSLEEKVVALDYYHKYGNKRQTVRKMGIPCAKMLRHWLRHEAQIRGRLARYPCGGCRVVGRAAAASVTERHDGAEVGAGAEMGSGGVMGEGWGAALAQAIPPHALERFTAMVLQEDAPSLDLAGAVVGDAPRSATLFAKSTGVLAGVPFFRAIFEALGCTVQFRPPYADAAAVVPAVGDPLPLAAVRGPANRLLQGERPALNVLAVCSGVATAARAAVEVAAQAGWAGRLAGTRKTTPGCRLLEKYAMIVGGMDAHRMDLSAMVMLKDNHIAAAGGVRPAVAAARALAGFSLKIDVECASLGEALEAAAAGAEIVMLDNFEPAELMEAARTLKQRFPQVIVEASGGIDLTTLDQYFFDEVDVISFSVNRLASPMDLSLKIDR